MSSLELLLAVIGAGGVTTIITALVTARVSLRTAELSKTATAHVHDIEKAKVDTEILRVIISERNAEVARVRLDAATEVARVRAEAEEDRVRLRTELAEERAAAAAIAALQEKEHRELVRLRLLLAAHEGEGTS